jgi:hypothetical protein
MNDLTATIRLTYPKLKGRHSLLSSGCDSHDRISCCHSVKHVTNSDRPALLSTFRQRDEIGRGEEDTSDGREVVIAYLLNEICQSFNTVRICSQDREEVGA